MNKHESWMQGAAAKAGDAPKPDFATMSEDDLRRFRPRRRIPVPGEDPHRVVHASHIVPSLGSARLGMDEQPVLAVGRHVDDHRLHARVERDAMAGLELAVALAARAVTARATTGVVHLLAVRDPLGCDLRDRGLDRRRRGGLGRGTDRPPGAGAPRVICSSKRVRSRMLSGGLAMTHRKRHRGPPAMTRVAAWRVSRNGLPNARSGSAMR